MKEPRPGQHYVEHDPLQFLQSELMRLYSMMREKGLDLNKLHNVELHILVDKIDDFEDGERFIARSEGYYAQDGWFCEETTFFKQRWSAGTLYGERMSLL